MAMEVLSKLLEQAVQQGQIRVHPKCSEPLVSHLLFADDLLVFCECSRHSLSAVKRVLHQFKLFSGLDMNPSKSVLLCRLSRD